ncbi:efflux RND transporter periplasmic adaptor subunit [Poriferisphaera sp. WC338]|uniref:efflux RND transporter periplasmic adaptor subunit n=1 Tax=Poriferisphaera sp. WC338 TaxID=3425129 RepID=UPI003D8168C2
MTHQTGHSTVKVFWVSMITCLVGVVLGGLIVGAVYQFVITKFAEEGIAQYKTMLKEQAEAGMPPANVRVADVQLENVQDRFDVVGRLEELQMSKVASEVEGKIKHVPVREGDVVKGGETVIAEVDGTWVQLAFESAKADEAARRATLDQSMRDLTMLEALEKARSAKPKEVADARAKVKSDSASLEAAQAAVRRAEEQLSRLNIIAPFDGVVISRDTEEGQWVNPGAGIASLISSGTIDAVVNVPERYINQIKVGDEVVLSMDAMHEEVKGNVVSVTPMGSSSSRTFPVKVRMSDENGRLLPGMSVTARLPIGEPREQVTVSKDAILQTVKGPVIWVAMPNPKGEGMPMAMSVPVKLLFGLGDRMVVEPVSPTGKAMLGSGTQVVVMGAERIFMPGQPLMIDGGAMPGSDVKQVEHRTAGETGEAKDAG